MPSSMIHLLTAYKYDPKSSVMFLLGNLIPDSVSEWKAKDIIHFRDKEDRIGALREFANSLDLKNKLNLGILLHLFLDNKWDSDSMKKFIESYNGEDWIHAYRNEIALASAWYYHHSQWSTQTWNDMELYSRTTYDDMNGFIKENIVNFVQRNHKWHQENNIGPSTVFSIEFIEKFSTEVVNEFKYWVNQFL